MTGTAVAVHDEEPLKPFLSKMEEDLRVVLPATVTPARFIKDVLVAASKNPDIAKCTKLSIGLAVMKAAQLGLDVGEDIHFVPIGGKCEAWPDYKGLIRLAMQANIVRNMVPYVVREGELFDWEQGLHEFLRHRPNDDIKAKITHAYAIIGLRYGAKTFHVMPIAEIEARRAKSKTWSRGEPLAWYCKKTVIRDWLNRQPKSAKLRDALESDEVVEGLPERPANVTEDGEISGTVSE